MLSQRYNLLIIIGKQNNVLINEIEIVHHCTNRFVDYFQNPNQNQLCSNQTHTNANNSTRRHTVGPGDVAHEHALQDQNVVALNFKCEPSNNQQQTHPYPPINLPMLQNQPLHYLTIKDQHLLKPPLAMGASKS